MASKTPYYFEVYKDAAGKFRWRFWAPNSRIMADSGQGYIRKESCIDAINEICREARFGLNIETNANAARAA